MKPDQVTECTLKQQYEMHPYIELIALVVFLITGLMIIGGIYFIIKRLTIVENREILCALLQKMLSRNESSN